MTIESPQLFADPNDVTDLNDSSLDQNLIDAAQPQDSKASDAMTEPSKPDVEPKSNETPGPNKKASETIARPARSKVKKSVSKAARIRDYMVENPLASNIEIVKSLSEFGVKYPDVAGVRGLMKRNRTGSNESSEVKAAVKPASKAAAPPSMSGGRPKKASKSRSKAAKQTAAVNDKSNHSEITLADLETALSFIEKVHGVENARRIIDLVARIRHASID